MSIYKYIHLAGLLWLALIMMVGLGGILRPVHEYSHTSVLFIKLAFISTSFQLGPIIFNLVAGIIKIKTFHVILK